MAENWKNVALDEEAIAMLDGIDPPRLSSPLATGVAEEPQSPSCEQHRRQQHVTSSAAQNSSSAALSADAPTGGEAQGDGIGGQPYQSLQQPEAERHNDNEPELVSMKALLETVAAVARRPDPTGGGCPWFANISPQVNCYNNPQSMEEHCIGWSHLNSFVVWLSHHRR